MNKTSCKILYGNWNVDYFDLAAGKFDGGVISNENVSFWKV